MRSRYEHNITVNFYTGEPMEDIDFSEGSSFCDFSYIPVETDGLVSGYFLIVYGRDNYFRKDVDGDGEGDHVMMVLSDEDEPDMEKLAGILGETG